MPKICQEKGCDKEAKYNFKGEKEKKFCVDHKDTKMICLEEKSKYCIDETCCTRASYNLPTIKKAIFCMDHADLTKMINVNAKRCLKCTSQATFNVLT